MNRLTIALAAMALLSCSPADARRARTDRRDVQIATLKESLRRAREECTASQAIVTPWPEAGADTFYQLPEATTPAATRDVAVDTFNEIDAAADRVPEIRQHHPKNNPTTMFGVLIIGIGIVVAGMAMLSKRRTE